MEILQCKAHPSSLLTIQLHYAAMSLTLATFNSPLEFTKKHRSSKNGLGTKGLTLSRPMVPLSSLLIDVNEICAKSMKK